MYLYKDFTAATYPIIDTGYVKAFARKSYHLLLKTSEAFLINPHQEVLNPVAY